MIRPDQVVFIVDNDEAVRDSIARLVANEGFTAKSYASASEFLAGLDPAASGCVVAEVVMPGLSGLQLMEKLRDKGIAIPSILITDRGTVSMAVAALKAGAADFLEKPFDERRLLESVISALKRDITRRERELNLRQLRQRYAGLTDRERQVMALVTDGLSNKEVAERFNISPRTVEVFRSTLMSKMRARNLADLVRIAILLSYDERE
jgi:two-component system, LuxR family, response regulator FixJ